jgi:hypothetical protein
VRVTLARPYLQLVKLLLEHGADASAKVRTSAVFDPSYMLYMRIASAAGSAHDFVQDSDGNTPLVACVQGEPSVMRRPFH